MAKITKINNTAHLATTLLKSEITLRSLETHAFPEINHRLKSETNKKTSKTATMVEATTKDEKDTGNEETLKDHP
jgi:hypothetical protein